MEHILLPSLTIESDDLDIGSARLGNRLIAEDNKASTSVDRWERSDRDSPFGSRKSGIKISVDFGQNVDDKIAMNLSRSIRILNPQIISNKLRNCNIFNSVSRVFL